MIDPIEQKAIGERIRHARRLRNMTQGDIDKAIGVKAAAVWQIENGRVPEKRIPQIAAALDVSIEDLLGGPVIADMTRDEAETVRTLRTLPAEGRAYIAQLMADLARGEVTR